MCFIRLQFAVIVCLGLGFHGRAEEPSVHTSLTVLQTADIHAESLPGVWSRLASLIHQERDRAGGPDYSLLIDCGDTISGTLQGNLAKGEPDLQMLKHLGYDAWVPGNHEFDFGSDHLAALLEKHKPPAVCANLRFHNGPELPAWQLIKKNDLRIALIGMTNPNLHHWIWHSRLKGAEVQPLIPILKRLLPEIQKSSVDLIILAVHQGSQFRETRMLEEINEIGKAFPQIDLILGSHTHRAEPGRKLGNVWYVQPGAHGEYLAQIKIKINRKTRRVEEIESSLLPSVGVTPDPEADKLMEPWREKAERYSERVIQTATRPLSGRGRPGRNCAMSDLICRAIATATNAEVVFHPVFAPKGWQAGAITERELFMAIPYENHVVCADLTTEQLRAILTEQLQLSGTRHENGLWGIRAIVEDRENRVIELPAAAGERRRVAFTSYAASGGGGRFPFLRRTLQRTDVNATISQADTREMLRQYLKQTPSWQQPPRSWNSPAPK